MKQVRVKETGLFDKLRKTVLLRYFGDETLQRLLAASRFVQCEPGERIIEEHALDDRMYVIMEHSVAVMVHQDEQEVYIATIGAGEVVGEAAIFANFPRTASVDANDETVLLEIHRNTFIAALREDPGAGMRVLFLVVHSLLSKLREVNLELAFERRLQTDQDEIDSMITGLLGPESDDSGKSGESQAQ